MKSQYESLLKISYCIFLFFITAPLHPDEATRLAVFDLKPVGVSATAALTVSGMIRRDLQSIGRFRIIESSRMNALLMEKVFHPLECSDRDCAMRAGKILGADKVAVGEIGTLGNSFVITVRISTPGRASRSTRRGRWRLLLPGSNRRHAGSLRN